MSYFDDQYEAWMKNRCKGNIEDYDPYGVENLPADDETDDENKEG